VKIKDHAGEKYIRRIHSCANGQKSISVDVYEVLEAFAVACPARQHAIKKLLCSGLRGKGSELDDLREAGMSICRAIEMQERKELKPEHANDLT
jgi:hypothetical protein